MNDNSLPIGKPNKEYMFNCSAFDILYRGTALLQPVDMTETFANCTHIIKAKMKA